MSVDLEAAGDDDAGHEEYPRGEGDVGPQALSSGPDQHGAQLRHIDQEQEQAQADQPDREPLLIHVGVVPVRHRNPRGVLIR